MTKRNLKMSLRILSVAMLLLVTFGIESTYAVPAKKGVMKVEQADGTQLNILLHGDEHFNWSTTESGYTIAMGSDGYYYYVDYEQNGNIKPTAQRVSINNRLQAAPAGLSKNKINSIAQDVATQRRAAAKSNSNTTKASSAFPHMGTIRSAVILVEYADVKFSISNPNQAFYNQLNQEGYSVAGATGSAKDYFKANSRGQFDGQFDVYGPYTLSNNRSYYGGNDSAGNDHNPEGMVKEAVTLADQDGADFSIYDYDKNGIIDNIFVYYAGHNPAEGGPAEAVWPHKFSVWSRPVFDGKVLFDYACTSELRGKAGATIAGIGTFCHEFSHVFGLADHYDTNGSTYGYCEGLGTFDIMTSGSYNNDGNTPPMHNALELDMIGWVEPTVVTRSYNVEAMEPIATGKTYKILTETEGEYFLVENRHQDAIVWDKFIEGNGVIISHVDRSSNYISLWDSNGPNTKATHECFKFVVAGNKNLSGYNWHIVPYPYAGNNSWTSTSAPKAQSWGYKDLEYNIIDIKSNADCTASFKIINSNTELINIMVGCDAETVFVGDQITLTCAVYPEQADSSVTWSSSDDSIAEIDQDGNACFIAAGEVTFTATLKSNPDYSQSVTVTAKKLQGALGFVANSSEEMIQGANIAFYPTTASVQKINGVESRVYTRASNFTQYKATTGSNGEYLLEIPAGNYETEISAANYTNDLSIVEINEGSNEISFTLTSNTETIEAIDIVPFQTGAFLKWNPGKYSSFKVNVTKGFSSDTFYVTDSQFTLNNLSNGSEYTLEISGLNENDGYDKLYSEKFSTLASVTSTPIILIGSYEWKAGTILDLNTLNTTENDAISWYFDGELVQLGKIKLETGRHTIQAVVIRDNATYRANRVINVK